jgi:hypothetical protein
MVLSGALCILLRSPAQPRRLRALLGCPSESSQSSPLDVIQFTPFSSSLVYLISHLCSPLRTSSILLSPYRRPPDLAGTLGSNHQVQNARLAGAPRDSARRGAVSHRSRRILLYRAKLTIASQCGTRGCSGSTTQARPMVRAACSLRRFCTRSITLAQSRYVPVLQQQLRDSPPATF